MNLFGVLKKDFAFFRWVTARRVCSGLRPFYSISQGFMLACILAFGSTPSAEAFRAAEELELPSVQGWQITAVRRMGDSAMFRAQKTSPDGVRMLLLATNGEYGGGKWFFTGACPSLRLKRGVEEANAQLILNGNLVVKGKALAVSDSIGNKITARYIRFEFPKIDPHLEVIEAATGVELKVDGLTPAKLEPLSSIITALKRYMKEDSNPDFWKNAKDVCN